MPFATLVVIGLLSMGACRNPERSAARQALLWSGWIEDTAVHRGHVQPGDIAQFGCPPGWMGVGDTAAAVRGREVPATYMGADPKPREGTITCVAQREFALPAPGGADSSPQDPARRPLTPVWLDVAPDSMTIVFSRELPPTAAVYLGQDTPCGPRLMGVRLGDLLKWMSDPRSATTRDFLGMVSAGCPERSRP